MWFIFIAVLIVVAVMLVFLLMGDQASGFPGEAEPGRVLYEEPGSL